MGQGRGKAMDEKKSQSLESPVEERISFANDWPCRLRSRDSNVDELALPHYASTIEIVLTRGVRGLYSVGAQQFLIDGEDSVFFVAPQRVHYSHFTRQGGRIHVFKISPELLGDYLELEKLLSTRKLTLHDIPAKQSKSFQPIYDIILNKISYVGDGFAMIRGVVELFRILCDSVSHTDEQGENRPTNEKIRRIIQWTKEHVGERITVEDAAAFLHYSKYHFCRIFKENTGVSYLKYLNTMKIDYAIRLMKQGYSATYCCFECGFDSLAYFLKLFKDVTGYTTKEYKKIMEGSGETAIF